MHSSCKYLADFNLVLSLLEIKVYFFLKKKVLLTLQELSGILLPTSNSALKELGGVVFFQTQNHKSHFPALPREGSWWERSGAAELPRRELYGVAAAVCSAHPVSFRGAVACADI